MTQNKAKYCHGAFILCVALHVPVLIYRSGCAYKRGVCAICGKQVLDTTGYVMSSK